MPELGGAHANSCYGHFTGDFSGALWNCRSLWSHDEDDTMVFANVLVRSLDFLVLTETRATDSRLAFLKTKLAPNLEYF